MLKTTDAVVLLKQKSYFQQRYSIDQRIAMSERTRKDFPERIPVILEPMKRLPSGSPFPNNKYAVPQQYLISSLAEIVTGGCGRKAKLYIRLESYPSNWTNWLLSYVNDMSLVSAPLDKTLLEVYSLYKHGDGLLYIAYTVEK